MAQLNPSPFGCAPRHQKQDFKDCLVVIEKQLAEFNGMCEYPIYVKALIKRQQGGGGAVQA